MHLFVSGTTWIFPFRFSSHLAQPMERHPSKHLLRGKGDGGGRMIETSVSVDGKMLAYIDLSSIKSKTFISVSFHFKTVCL